MGNHENSQGLGEIILHNCTYAGCASQSHYNYSWHNIQGYWLL